MPYTVGSLFAGIGGFDLAFTAAGFDIAYQVEKDDFCQKVLAKHWPHVKRYGDIYECHNLPFVDVMTAGFPCQPFSAAGKRQGANDERYLIPEMLRVISEVQPYVVFLENVAGFTTLNDGSEFRALLREIAAIGYDAEWGHLRAENVGAPHRRERWFCVAYRANAGINRRQRGESDDATSRKSGCEPNRNRANGGVNAFMVNASQYLSSDFGKGDARAQEQTVIRTAGQWDDSESLCETPTVGNTDALRIQGERPVWEQESCEPAELFERTSDANGHELPTQSGLVRDVARLPGWLDEPQWPSRPNEPQYDYEPPRVAAKGKHHKQRLQALGNAVVPQVIYPLALAIKEYLENDNP